MEEIISIPRALAGPDWKVRRSRALMIYFNPQGPRRPRHNHVPHLAISFEISIPRALAGPDGQRHVLLQQLRDISIPRALAGPDHTSTQLN